MAILLKLRIAMDDTPNGTAALAAVSEM